MLAVIKKYDLLKYNEQGKRRSKEVMKEAIAKAYAKLR
jgi:hypothetical protein